MALDADTLFEALHPQIQENIQPLIEAGYYDAFYAITGYMIQPGNFWKVQSGQAVQDQGAYQYALTKAQQRAQAIAETLAGVMAEAISNNVSRILVDELRPWLVDNAEITCTIAAMDINTAGSATAQVGPPADVDISGIIDEGP